MRILYLKDPISQNKNEIILLDKTSTVIHTISSREDFYPLLREFVPHIILCSLNSPISVQEVLDIMDVGDEKVPFIFSFVGSSINKVIPLIEASSNLLLHRETSAKVVVEKRTDFEDRFKSFYDTSYYDIIISQPDGTILAANPEAGQLLKISEEEICRRGFRGIVAPNVAREQKEARMSAALEISKIGYWELDLATKTLFFSDMLYKILGQEKSSFHPTWSSIKKIIHPEDYSKFLKAHKNSILHKREHIIEYRIVNISGKVRWVHERGRVLTWKNNNPLHIERTVQDVTSEKEYSERIATSESRYKAIVNSQTNYLIRTDLQGNYTFCNDKFIQDFGWLYNRNNVSGQPSLSAIMDYHRQEVINIAEHCIKNPGNAYQIELDRPKKKGGIRTTLWDFICLLDTAGKRAEIQCMGIDISARIKAQKKLKDSKLRYKLITSVASDAIWDWDITTGKLLWGKTFKSIFGYKPEQYTSIDAWTGLIHIDDRSRVKMELNSAIEGLGKKWICGYRLKRKNAGYAYVILKGSILRNEKNKAYRLVGALQDITEKKKLEDLLATATTLSRIGSFELNLIKKTLYWSPVTQEIHEVKKDYSPNLHNAFNFYKGEVNRKKIIKVLRKTIDKKKSFEVELEIITKKGKEIWVRAIGKPVIENDQCIGIQGSFQDIDKIKRAELGIRNLSREKENILESIDDAFFSVDKYYNLNYSNKPASILLNHPKSIISKKNIWEIFPDSIGTSFQRNMEETMEDKKKRQFEAHFDKSASWYDVTVYPSNDGLSIFFKNITERKNTEVRLRELNKNLKAHSRELVMANKGLEQFSYIVSHNLRAPVANVLGLADLLQKENYSHQIKENLFAEIFSNIQRLDTVIQDLNSILQVKVDIQAKKEDVNLFELIDRIKSSIQTQIKESNAEIKCNFEKLDFISSVPSYLYSIFYNLILNSIKYRRPDLNPVIEINGLKKGMFIFLSIKDNGLGMDLSSKQDQIFNLYKRFHHHVEGKGMGLFMVKTQVEMLGGKISLKSTVNKGTTFTLIFHNKTNDLNIENEKSLSISGN